LEAATVNNLSIVQFPFILKSPLSTNVMCRETGTMFQKGICVKSSVKLS
ncbi:hypothetical protein T03_4319, partial [Trichinella britovi]